MDILKRVKEMDQEHYMQKIKSPKLFGKIIPFSYFVDL